MRRLLTISALTLLANINNESMAQQVPKAVVVEHFTNSYCSVCASRNPGMYATLAQHTDVMHIAYHPSSPYAACTINQHNKAENDARTNFYGIFGGTPRIVVQGNVIPASTNYGDASLYTSEKGKMSSFSVKTELKKAAGNTADVTVTVKKVDTSSITSLQLYAVVAEDTFFFNAPNGENIHHDVFRKSVWGAPQAITTLTNVGDSVVMTQNIAVHQDWVGGRTYVAALLQDGNKQMIQAARSATLDFPVGINMTNTTTGLTIFPNPAGTFVTLKGLGNSTSEVTIITSDGRIADKLQMNKNNTRINTGKLTPGLYFISVADGSQTQYLKLIKR